MSSLAHLLRIGIAVVVHSRHTGTSKGSRFLENVAKVYSEHPTTEGIAPSATIVDLVLNLIDRRSEDFVKDVTEKLAAAALILGSFDGSPAAAIIAKWQNERLESRLQDSSVVNPGSPAEEDGAEKRKLAAKQRKAAIMAEFARQQQSFMESLGNVPDDQDEDMDDPSESDFSMAVDVLDARKCDSPAGNCIICQEPLQLDSAPYGMVSLLQNFKEGQNEILNLKSIDDMRLLVGERCSLDTQIDRPSSSTFGENVTRVEPPSSEFSPPQASVNASSCGHLMHYSCFQSYRASIERRQVQEFRNQPENLELNEFLCPLCKSLGNTLVPIRDSYRTETINWSGLHKGSSTSVVPPDKGGRKNSVAEMEAWWNNRGAAIFLGAEAAASTEAVSDVELASKLRSLLEQISSGLIVVEQFTGNNSPNPNFIADESTKRLSQMATQLLIESDSFTPFLPIAADCLASSISSVEKMLRGVGTKSETVETSVNFLETVNPTTMLFLGVFVSDLRAVLRVVRSRTSDTSPFAESNRATTRLIFDGARPAPARAKETRPFGEPILRRKSISLLTELSFYEDWGPAELQGDDVFMLVGLVWCIEVTKVLLSFVESIILYDDTWAKDEGLSKLAQSSLIASSSAGLSAGAEADHKGKKPASYSSQGHDDSDLGQIKDFLHWISRQFEWPVEEVQRLIDVRVESVAAVAKSACLPFLRSAALLLHARFGLVPATGSAGFGLDPSLVSRVDNQADEYGQLLAYLRLPAVSYVCSAITNNPVLSSLATGWISDLRSWKAAQQTTEPVVRRLVTLDAPGVLELVPLPRSLESLLEDCFPKVCQSCRKRVAEPGLCLLCGAVVCAISYCCSRDGVGECNQHVRVCAGSVGVFFLVKSFRILVLHKEKGALMEPPYLDSHGEVDLAMRKGGHQFLHARRYDEIRRVWLTRGIPSHVARSLENTPSYGGWSLY
ncbi:hypothetical protein HK405_009369 [Cladochytrium tenue]|nr:hypothetical protein HK405_009369 [Cladochytrium tenue]